MKKEIVTLGFVGVDSGQLIICDPCYLKTEYVQREFKSSHEIYRHSDGKLWQFTFSDLTEVSNVKVNPFPGTYEDIIPEYGKNPNQLIKDGDFQPSGIDTMAYIPNGEFSYAGIAKATLSNELGGQLNYAMGHPGVSVAFRSGLGDGSYEVKAEIIHFKTWGKRISKVWVELITDEEIEELERIN